MPRYNVKGHEKTIVMDLDSIITNHKKFQNDIKGFSNILVVAIDNALDVLREMAIEFGKESLSKYGLHDSQLYHNFNAERIKNGIYVTTHGESTWGLDYAMYVEFGTGIVGKEGTPHPDLSERGWRYDVNQHGEKGWVYPSYPEDPNRNKWQDLDGNYWAWTKGQESRPFMYDTWLKLSRNWQPVMSEYIDRAFEEWGESL